MFLPKTSFLRAFRRIRAIARLNRRRVLKRRRELLDLLLVNSETRMGERRQRSHAATALHFVLSTATGSDETDCAVHFIVASDRACTR